MLTKSNLKTKSNFDVGISSETLETPNSDFHKYLNLNIYTVLPMAR